MAEKPILFSAPMVKAILSGCKTQTRRAIKPQPPEGFRLWGRVIDDHASWTDHPTQGEKGQIVRASCPYGKPDNLLWVRETWCPLNRDYKPAPRSMALPADGENVIVSYRADHIDSHGDAMPCEWRPSIFMPRWASRITLRITDIRAERLQEMRFADWITDFAPTRQELNEAHASFTGAAFRVNHSRKLWDSINAERGYSWDSNPWVWVVEFYVETAK